MARWKMVDERWVPVYRLDFHRQFKIIQMTRRVFSERLTRFCYFAQNDHLFDCYFDKSVIVRP